MQSAGAGGWEIFPNQLTRLDNVASSEMTQGEQGFAPKALHSWESGEQTFTLWVLLTQSDVQTPHGRHPQKIHLPTARSPRTDSSTVQMHGLAN